MDKIEILFSLKKGMREKGGIDTVSHSIWAKSKLSPK